MTLNIKRTLLALCCMKLTAMSYAYDFESNGIYYNITSLQDLKVEVTSGDTPYSGDVAIPSTVEYSNKTFTVTKLGDSAFSGSSQMTSISIPNTVITAGSYVFKGCQSLTSLTIPSTMTSIANGAFTGCYSLNNLVIDDGDTSLSISYKEYQVNNYSSFLSCPLRSVYIGRNIGGGSSDYHAKFYNKTQLTELTIGDKVTEIGDFVGCSNLEHINIPSNVSQILSYAFRYCTKLKDITLNEGLQSIQTNSFEGCTSIHTILIPSTVTRISSGAFQDCTGITRVYSKATTPATIQELTFPGIVYLNAVLYVPTGTKSLYEAATGWKDFSSIVETDNFDDLTTYYSFNVSTTAGGTVSVLGNTLSNTSLSASVKEGDDVAMTFTPNDGYELKSLVVNGEDVTSKVTNNSYTVSSVSKNTTIVVTFAELPVYLTIKSADNGSIAQVVEKGKTYSFTITPSDGWEIESVSYNGTDVTSQLNDNKYTTPSITSNSELNVVYKQTAQSAVKAVGKANGIRVSASYGTLSIENNGDATSASVYSTDGSMVASESVGIGTTTIDLPTNNVYIVKVGTETFKVSM